MLQISGRGPIAIMHRFFFLGAILASAKDEDLFAVRPINQLHLQSGLHRSPVCFQ